MGFRRPRPKPAAAPAAYDTMTLEERADLAKQAVYVGSPDHTDIPKFGIAGHPRPGATTIEVAEEQRLKNPSCTVCPRKWARRQDDVRNLLRRAIEAGNFAATDGLPHRVWARDPDDPELVYEAKRVSHPQNGYKAYPLTSFQAKYNLPIVLP
jgi:hypothetical protein